MNELFDKDKQILRTERRYEKIVQQILCLIDEGQLEPGDRLPSERNLAEELDCSRTSLREAVRVLESEGLIISKMGGGRYIQGIDRRIPYQFSRTDILEKTAILYFLEARETIEPKIAELASLRATKTDIEKLENILDNMEKNLKDSDVRLAEDSNFHMALAEATQNFVLVSMMEANLQMIKQVRKQTLVSESRPNQALAEHHIILRAIKNSEPDDAAQAIQQHLQHLKESVLNFIKN
jgi:GntR family transcriptional repressor for pyruvate dehydrogenase complex